MTSIASLHCGSCTRAAGIRHFRNTFSAPIPCPRISSAGSGFHAVSCTRSIHAAVYETGCYSNKKPAPLRIRHGQSSSCRRAGAFEIGAACFTFWTKRRAVRTPCCEGVGDSGGNLDVECRSPSPGDAEDSGKNLDVKCRSPSPGDNEDSSSEQEGGSKPRSFLQIAASVGFVTAMCKVLGTIREMLLAARFGVGPVVDAFNYASIVPGFFLSIVGGINGPCHSAVTSALGGTRSKREASELTEAASTMVGLMLLPISVLVFLCAGPLIDLAAPGLAASGNILTRTIAVQQLRVMAPCTLLSGFIGVAFGSLSHAGVYLVPALSPACTSLTTILAVVLYSLRHGWTGTGVGGAHDHGLAVGVLPAGGFMLGACMQGLLQAGAMAAKGFSAPLKFRWLDPRTHAPMRKVLAVMLPACVGSGMLQLATYVDLYFASFIPGAAAAMGYANLLAMAPLGILSNSLLVPTLPRFTQLSAQEQWPQLRRQVRQALVVAIALGLPLAALMCPLAPPTVRIVLQRKAFDSLASARVAAILQCYVLGAPLYLARDVLVRAFYALGDGNVPFWISCSAIGGNFLLDWYFVTQLGFGAPGLVIATVIVNFISVIAFLILLSKRIGNLELGKIWRTWMSLGLATAATACVARLIYFVAAPHNINVVYSTLTWLTRTFRLPIKLSEGVASPFLTWGADGLVLAIAAGSCVLVYVALLMFLRVDKTMQGSEGVA